MRRDLLQQHRLSLLRAALYRQSAESPGLAWWLFKKFVCTEAVKSARRAFMRKGKQ